MSTPASDGGSQVSVAPLPARTNLSRRRVHERRQRRRSTLIATISTVVVGTVVYVAVTSADGWPEVRDSFLSRSQFVDSWPGVRSAFWLNIRIFLIAEVCILVLALAIALARSSRAPALFPLRLAAIVYTDLFRGIPVLLVLFILGFGVPALRFDHVPNDPVFWASVALILSYSAYVSEVYRAGIDSVHESQRAAARSLGLSSAQTLRFVVVPQAVRRVVPPLLNDFIALQKETALVGVIGPIEAARRAQIDSSRDFNFTSYLTAALLFLLITVPLTRLTDWLLARQRRRTTTGAVG